MWVMVLGDMVIFAGYFIVFMIYRSMRPGSWPRETPRRQHRRGQHRDPADQFMARRGRGHRHPRASQVDRAIRLLYCGGLGGVLFTALKGCGGWPSCVPDTPTPRCFYSFYYVVGVHLIHVLIRPDRTGILVRELRNPGRRRATVGVRAVLLAHGRSAGVIIFALFYVMIDRDENQHHNRPKQATTWAWLILVAITIGSWWLAPAHSGGTAHPSAPITALVLLLAIVKSRLDHSVLHGCAPRPAGSGTAPARGWRCCSRRWSSST